MKRLLSSCLDFCFPSHCSSENLAIELLERQSLSSISSQCSAQEETPPPSINRPPPSPDERVCRRQGRASLRMHSLVKRPSEFKQAKGISKFDWLSNISIGPSSYKLSSGDLELIRHRAAGIDSRVEMRVDQFAEMQLAWHEGGRVKVGWCRRRSEGCCYTCRVESPRVSAKSLLLGWNSVAGQHALWGCQSLILVSDLPKVFEIKVVSSSSEHHFVYYQVVSQSSEELTLVEEDWKGPFCRSLRLGSKGALELQWWLPMPVEQPLDFVLQGLSSFLTFSERLQ